MDKESITLLQKVDSNCNDCVFMQRDFDKYNSSVELHKKWQLDYFEMRKRKVIEKAKEWKDKGEDAKSQNLLNEAGKMKFIFDKSSAIISFGNCVKFSKPVSFVPNVCQLETQECFEHRKG